MVGDRNSEQKQREHLTPKEMVENTLKQYLFELNKNRLSLNIAETFMLSSIREDGLGKASFLVHGDLNKDGRRLNNGHQYATTFLTDLQRDLGVLFGNRITHIGMLYEIATIFLRAFCDVFGRYVVFELETYEWLRDSDLIAITNLAVTMYLEQWLASDRSNYQTLYGFAAHPYEKEKRSKNKTYSGCTDERVKKIQRSYNRQAELFVLRQKQARKEGVISKYKQHDTKGFGRPLDLITLAWCDAWAERKISILDYLLYKQKIMDRAEDVRSKRSLGLRRAWENYEAYIQHLDNLDIRKDAPLRNVRKFVSSSMMLHRLERAYRFHLNARIASRKCENSIELRNFYSPAWNVFYGRFESSKSQLFAPAWAKHGHEEGCTGRHAQHKTYVYADEPVDILHIDFCINHMFSVDGNKQSRVETQLGLQRRQLMQDLTLFLFACYPVENQGAWTEDIFRDAAKHYKEEYPVVAELSEMQSLVFPHAGNQNYSEEDFYSQFKEIYKIMEENEELCLAKGRESLIGHGKNK